MNTVRIGIVGFGWMGLSHTRALLSLSYYYSDFPAQLDLVFCVETTEIGRASASRFPFRYISNDLDACLNSHSVDIVYIVTPNFKHIEQIEKCDALGITVFCEKPVGINLKEIELLTSVDCALGIGYNYRWFPLVQQAKVLIESNRIGDVISYRSSFYSNYGSGSPTPKTWRYDRTLGGGVSLDLLSHVVDMAIFLVGDMRPGQWHRRNVISSRYESLDSKTRSKSWQTDTDDYAMIGGDFTSGGFWSIDASRVFNGPESLFEFAVYGTKGSVRWCFEDLNRLYLFLLDSPERGWQLIRAGQRHQFHRELIPFDGSGIGFDHSLVIQAREFLTSYLNNTRFVCDLKHGVKVHRIIDVFSKGDQGEA